MRRKQSGVTLVELMISVGIIGILAAIAYPSYQAQVRRGNRTDAKAELMEAAQEMEKCFTRFGRYLPTAAGQCVAFDDINDASGRPSEKGKYVVTFDGTQPPTDTTYRLIATRVAGSGPDPECGNFTLDQTGLRGVVGGTDTAQRCW
jgi:type IV pilus assembly protein PilE